MCNLNSQNASHEKTYTIMAKLKQIRIVLFLLVFILDPFRNTSAQSLQTKIDSLILKDFNDKNGPGGAFWSPIMEKQFIKRLSAKQIWN